MAVSPEKRASFLRDSGCDPDILLEAESLLECEAEAEVLFPIEEWRDRSDGSASNPAQGTAIDRYVLLRELGRGGMGTVFLAERADGVYRQQVALKVLQSGILTEQLRRRFETERQILAGLTHPGICRLLDGGVTAQGIPYLVMEYVDGEQIDRFCEDRTLSTEERLRLFLKVAESIQFAHQQLVLHLDIKPANILITAEGEPKLLDFGVARILEESEGEWQTSATIQLLTPRYASPEQIRGEKLGVASDVFSLATLLYRLLTGVLPYPVEGQTPLQAARLVCEREPQTASLAGPTSMREDLRGDIDAILLHALSKEPAGRYPTVAAFAADIKRHLDRVPVEARVITFEYTAGRFLRRHRTGALAAAGVLLVLLISGATVIRSAAIARQQRAEADRERAKAVQRFADLRALAHSYVFELDPKLEPIAGTVNVRSFVMKNGLKYLETMSHEFEGDDDLAREVMRGYSQIALVQADNTMPSLNDRTGAMQSIEKAIAIQKGIFARNPSLLERGELLRLMRILGQQFVNSGDPAAAASVIEQAWELREPMLTAGPKTPRYIYLPWLAEDMVQAKIGNGDEWNLADPVSAEHWLETADELAAKYAAGNPDLALSAKVVNTLQNLATTRAQLMVQLGRPAEAEKPLREALRLTSLGPADAMAVQSRKVVASRLMDYFLQQGNPQEASKFGVALDQHQKHEQGADRVLTSDEAEVLALFARTDLSSGRVEIGRRRMQQSLAILEGLYKSDPGEIDGSSSYATMLFDFAEASGLSSAERATLYLRAEEVARHYAQSHPTLLSGTLLAGRCELGMAKIAQAASKQDDTRRYASAAAADARTVLAAHPVQPQASALLRSAGSMLQ